jgi:hypothetical protein
LDEQSAVLHSTDGEAIIINSIVVHRAYEIGRGGMMALQVAGEQRAGEGRRHESFLAAPHIF